MISSNYQPLLVRSEVRSAGDVLDVSAKRSEDGKTLVLQVVNVSDQPTTAALDLVGFVPHRPVAKVLTMAGPLEARNTADQPDSIEPLLTEWRPGAQEGRDAYTFAAHSFTVITFSR